MDVEVIVTDHARVRLRDQLGLGDDDLAAFRPSARTRDGLRLWVHESGGGVLVREDKGTGWERLTVVSALTSVMIDATAERGGWSEVPRECEATWLHSGPAVPRCARDRWALLTERDQADLTRVVYEAVEREPRKTAHHYAKALRMDVGTVAVVLKQLKANGRVTGSKRWRALPMLPVPGADWQADKRETT